MKNIIYCYSGTGNSLWITDKLSEELGKEKTQIVFMNGISTLSIPEDIEGIGFIFPVHMWGVPRRVRELIQSLPQKKKAHFFAIAVHAGQVSRTLIQFKKLLKKKEIPLSLGFEIQMPSNYIPWGGAIKKEEQDKWFTKAKEKVSFISQAIQEKKALPVEKGPLWQRILFTAFYHLSFSKVAELDKNFWVNEKCNSCGICEKICPAKNITLSSEKNSPLWHQHCEQCLACIQWCPQKAIEYGKKTPAYERYHQREITLKRMLIK